MRRTKYLSKFASKKDEMRERIICEAELIIANKYTIRKCAVLFGWSKSTVHKDMTQRLPKIDAVLHIEVSKILAENLATRHIRGGIATKLKYKKGLEEHDKIICSKDGGIV